MAAIYEQTIPFPVAAEAAVVGGWRRRLAAVEALLLAADWNEARSQADALVAEIAAGVGGGGSDLLAQALRAQALAEAGLGLAEAAVWHWQMAQNLAIELRYESLAEYGSAGQLLAPHHLPWPDPFSPTGEDGEVPAGDPARRILAAPWPKYPDNVLDFLDGARVEVLIDSSGQVHAPLVVAGRAPGILYPALETLRHWRFAPQANPPLTRYEVTLPPPRHRKGWPAVDEDALALVKAARSAARRGQEDEAICLWQASLSLDAQLIKIEPAPSDPDAMLLVQHLILPADRWQQPSPRAGRRVGPRRDDVRAPVKIKAPPPQYPKKAHLRWLQGVVMVQATIDEKGRVTKASVVRQGLLPMEFHMEALKAFCRWRFEPATVGGEPISVHYTLGIGFHHKQKPSQKR
ncbi:MAG: energy transducer TonB [bacterium]|nr:energy transducer TonB [bacterium]